MWQNAIYQNLNLSLKRYHWENKKAVREKEQKPRMWTEWAHFLRLGKSSTPKQGGCRNSSQACRGVPSIEVTVEDKLNHDDTSTHALSLEPTGWLCQEPDREEWCEHGWHATQHGHFRKHLLLGFHPFGSICHQRQDSRTCRASRLLFQLVENWDCLTTLGSQCPRVHPCSNKSTKMGNAWSISCRKLGLQLVGTVEIKTDHNKKGCGSWRMSRQKRQIPQVQRVLRLLGYQLDTRATEPTQDIRAHGNCPVAGMLVPSWGMPLSNTS